MGGGNGQKAKMAREKHMERNKPAKGSQLETNKKGMNIQCLVCMRTFVCTTSEVKCQEHAEAKHPKSDLHTCFPHLKKRQLICELRTLRFLLLARNVSVIHHASI